MKRLAMVTTAAIAAAIALPAAAHGPEGSSQGHYGAHDGMMEMMHGFARRGGPAMMGGGYDGYGMMGGAGMMQGPGQMGFAMPGGIGHFGMSGAMFGETDRNGDGVISPEEARAAHTERLEEFDADGNGTLSIGEFEALHSAAIRELMVDRFQYLDADGDGNVTPEEMNAPIDRISRFMQMQERFGAFGPREEGEHDDDDRPRRRMDGDDMGGMGGGRMMDN